MPAKRTDPAAETFTAEEKAAMKETANERRAAKSGKADGERDVRAKIAEMEGLDREVAQRLHDLVKEVAPALAPRTWYGMPAYTKNGKVVVFFKPAGKFKSRYATLGFEDTAALDDGEMWSTSYAVVAMNDQVAARIAELVRTAAGG